MDSADYKLPGKTMLRLQVGGVYRFWDIVSNWHDFLELGNEQGEQMIVRCTHTPEGSTYEVMSASTTVIDELKMFMPQAHRPLPRYDPTEEERQHDTTQFEAWYRSGDKIPPPHYIWNAACAYARRHPLPGVQKTPFDFPPPRVVNETREASTPESNGT